MNGDGDEESQPQQKKPGIFLYLLYGSILALIILLLFSTFFSGESEININTIVTQNVEENLNCECKIFFDNETIQTKSEKFTLQRYANKEFSHKMITKKKKVAVFGECYCDGENQNHYEQSMAYLAKITSNEISFDFAFLKNNTNISFKI
ncbi:MAG: hypothetical protein CVT88_06350 [Candidatus Altiarchaeales archaeon HGW-Altiarchaeales-1]|nr:MAG: hypothetical protein CVT88_06350 [Candidatus Altiarchaeales archaeon HGW-Altiarchaeales-1]